MSIRRHLEKALSQPFAHDNVDYLPGEGIAGLYQQMDAWMRPKCKANLFTTKESDIGSPYFNSSLHKWLGKKYTMRLEEITKSDWTLLTMVSWKIHPSSCRLACAGMRPISQGYDPEYPLFYLSLLYRIRKCPSVEVWDALRGFLRHLSKAPSTYRPQRVYLRPTPISHDRNLKDLSVLEYIPSSISHESLIKKWQEEVGAYETNLQSPAGDYYYVVGDEFYKPPNREWDSNLPDKSLFDPR